MTRDDLKAVEDKVSSLINDHLELITVDAKGIAEARERAAKFLVAQSVLSTFLRKFEDDLARSVTMKDVTHAQAIQTAEGKNVTEKKANATLDTNYSNAREFNETLEAFKYWIKTHIKLFENAHLMFRQYSKE